MKPTIAYYLLLFYAAALLKPVLPLVKDLAAHAFAKEYHLATVHQHDGSQHVHREQAETSKQTQNEEKAPKSTFPEPVSVHLFSTQTLSTPPAFRIKEQVHAFVDGVLSKPVLDRVIPPPRTFPGV